MPNVQKVSVALTPEFMALLKEAVATGEYTSASEVIRDALRRWKERRAHQDSWETFARRATTGEWETTGRETLVRQRTGVMPETPTRQGSGGMGE